MTAKQLMLAADCLTGVHPGLSHEEIRVRQVSMTLGRLEAAYLIAEYNISRDGDERAGIVTRLRTLAESDAVVATQVNRALANRVSITRQSPGDGPRKHVSDEVRKREASRAYRKRRKAR